MTGAVNWYFEKIERERKIRLPSCIFDQNGLKQLDHVIELKSPIAISLFYQNSNKYFDMSIFEYISEYLKKPRIVYDDDKYLIKKLTEKKNNDPELFFDFAGNLFYIAELNEEMENTKNLSKTIKISLMLWIYLNMVELTTKYISEILLQSIKTSKTENKYEKFVKGFEDGKHPMIGETVDVLKKLGFLKDKGKTIFNENRVIRNRISHANMYYDSYHDSIYFSNGNQYTLTQFKKDFEDLLFFLCEAIYQFNNSNSELTDNVQKLFNEMSSIFLKIERAGLRRDLNKVVFEWEK